MKGLALIRAIDWRTSCSRSSNASAAHRVADHVGVALAQPEEPVGVQARIHAGQHHDPLTGRQRQVASIEVGRVLLGIPQELIRDTHSCLPRRKSVQAKLYKMKEHAASPP